VGHVEAKPEELDRLEPIPAAAAHRKRFVVADILDEAGQGDAIKLPVEGEAMALGEGRATEAKLLFADECYRALDLHYRLQRLF